MGHSPSVAKLQKQNEEFSKYIQSATDNLKARAQPEEANFTKEIDEYYNQNKWDRQPIARGENFDYRQAAEFSLTEINDTLQSISRAVFMGGAPPDGTVIDDAKAVAQIAAEMASFETLALAAATAFVNNILGAFDTGASTDYHSTIQQKSIAPGLTLHAWNYGDAFHSKDFFNDQFIIENGLAFQLIYSFAQAQMQQDIEYMNSHTQDISDLEDAITKMQKQIDDDMMDPNTSMDTINNLQDRVTKLKQMLEGYRDEVNKLVEKYKNEGKK